MIIDIDDLKLSRGGNPVLRDVRLHLDQGEIYGLLGPNGSGKTTTIAAALGLIPAESGRISVFGHDPAQHADAIRARVGVLPEQNGFYDWMDAEAYLRFFARLYGRELSAPAIAALLDRVGLAPRPRQAIATYSRGMRQRLGIARALVDEPDLLVLDEPTNGLDPRGRREMHDLLVDLAHGGTTVLLCTHLLDDVERLCTRIGILVDGRTVAEGEIEDLIADASARARYRLRLQPGQAAGVPSDGVELIAQQGDWVVVALDPGLRADHAWNSLLMLGWPIVEIRREGGELEELYLEMTEGAVS
jgi:ABC-2 type transport system ATP-binding protein